VRRAAGGVSGGGWDRRLSRTPNQTRPQCKAIGKNYLRREFADGPHDLSRSIRLREEDITRHHPRINRREADHVDDGKAGIALAAALGNILHGQRQALHDSLFAAQMALGWCSPNAVMQYAIPDLERLSIEIRTISARCTRMSDALGRAVSTWVPPPVGSARSI
jgi:hypothetical protein